MNSSQQGTAAAAIAAAAASAAGEAGEKAGEACSTRSSQHTVCIFLFRPAGGPLKICFPGLPCSRGPNRLVVRASAYSLKLTLPYRAGSIPTGIPGIKRCSLTKVLCFQHAYSHGWGGAPCLPWYSISCHGHCEKSLFRA